MEKIIITVIIGIIALLCFVLSYLQFAEKGKLLNNTYIYASEEEREKMNKTPYYKQSGSVFLLLGVLFSVCTVGIITKIRWMFYIVVAIAITAVVYAIASSVRIGNNK